MTSYRFINRQYRLTPTDLAEGTQRVVITNVTFQGLEEIHPVLHFDGQPKRLVCDPGQCNELARITNSAVCADWVGVALLLEAVEGDSGPTIRLRAAQDSLPEAQSSLRASPSPAPWFGPLGVIILLGALFLLVFLLERSDQLWARLLNLF